MCRWKWTVNTGRIGTRHIRGRLWLGCEGFLDVGGGVDIRAMGGTMSLVRPLHQLRFAPVQCRQHRQAEASRNANQLQEYSAMLSPPPPNRKLRKLPPYLLGALLASGLVLSGCADLILLGLIAGTDKILGERKDIRVVPTQYYSPQGVAKFKRLLVVSSTSGSGDGQQGQHVFWGQHGSSSIGMMQNRAVAALAKAGYEVLDQFDLEKYLPKEAAKAPDSRTMLRVAKQAGADAVLKFTVETGSKVGFGIFSSASGQYIGITSVSVRLIDVAHENTLAILSADYGSPQKPTKVMDTLAPTLTAVLQGRAAEFVAEDN